MYNVFGYENFARVTLNAVALEETAYMYIDQCLRDCQREGSTSSGQERTSLVL